MARRAKLTQEMVDEAIRLKADGLSNGDIICALSIHESTFYRWIGEPKTKLQRELSEGLKKEESAFKRTLLTTIRSVALARGLAVSSYFDTQRHASAVAVLGRLLIGDPRAPRDRPRDATNSPRRAASQGARQACCPAWP